MQGDLRNGLVPPGEALNVKIQKVVKLTAGLAAFALAAAVALLVWDWVRGAKPENRLVVYPIHRQLRLGMTMSEVERVVAAQSANKLDQHRSNDGRYVTLSIDVGLQATCDLRLEFKDGRLVHAFVRNGDSGRRPDDAPPDL
jgi:hypothetical protein